MDKVSFIIPNNDEKYKKDSLKLPELTTNLKNENTTKNKLNDYIKISENVYKFDPDNLNLNLDLDNNIYMLFNNACQIKKHNKLNAIEIFKKCRDLINNDVKDEIKYEIFINLALLVSELDASSNEIEMYYNKALKIYSDRGEPYYYWSIYCNKTHNFEKSYELLHKALLLSYDDANVKYPGTQTSAYGKYLYDNLSVACYWLGKYDQSKLLLETIIDDPDFVNDKERLEKNLHFTKNELEKRVQ